MFSRRTTDFLVGIGSPLLVIAAYAAHLGVPVGSPSMVIAAALTGAAVPVFDRFAFTPVMSALGLVKDRLLLFAARATLNGALGLCFAVALLPKMPL